MRLFEVFPEIDGPDSFQELVKCDLRAEEDL